MKRRTRKTITRISVLLFFTGTIFYFHKQVVRFGYLVYREYEWRNFPENIYSGPIDVPTNYSVNGIDVSRWQSNLDWKKLSALNSKGDTIPLSFALIKATEGILWEDPMFEDNWANAKKAGVTRGAYHYFKPNASPTLQAKNFIGSVALKQGDLPPVLDIEERGSNSKQEFVKSVKIYLQIIEQHYHCKPIIYSNVNFIENYLADDFSTYQFWIANYYVDKPATSGNIKWAFWQYRDRVRIAGCNECVDMNVFKGSQEDFNAILIQ